MNKVLQEDQKGKHGPYARKSKEITDEIKSFIANIPKVKSHYRHSELSRHYIEVNKFIANI